MSPETAHRKIILSNIASSSAVEVATESRISLNPLTNTNQMDLLNTTVASTPHLIIKDSPQGTEIATTEATVSKTGETTGANLHASETTGTTIEGKTPDITPSTKAGQGGTVVIVTTAKVIVGMIEDATGTS